MALSTSCRMSKESSSWPSTCDPLLLRLEMKWVGDVNRVHVATTGGKVPLDERVVDALGEHRDAHGVQGKSDPGNLAVSISTKRHLDGAGRSFLDPGGHPSSGSCGRSADVPGAAERAAGRPGRRPRRSPSPPNPSPMRARASYALWTPGNTPSRRPYSNSGRGLSKSLSQTLPEALMKTKRYSKRH